jgi:hypothetical protein
MEDFHGNTIHFDAKDHIAPETIKKENWGDSKLARRILNPT